jgi:chemotaxis protein MotB
MTTMGIKTLVPVFLGILLLTGCVTGRQYEELEALKNSVAAENDKLKKSNEKLSTANTELQAGLEDCKERQTALQSDTTILGTSLRHMRNQYDKINDLNEILSNKSSKLLQDAADENRVLLQQLELARLALQQKEDSLYVLEADVDAKQTDLKRLSDELKSRETRVNELEELIAAKDAAVNALKNTVSEALLGFKDKGLTIEQKNGKVYVSLEAKLLFPSGSTVINEEGKKALIDLAKAIENEADLDIIVEGHTDTDKIKSSDIPRDNWELSVLRATAVVKIMLANSAVSPQILSASGRSEFHPVDEADKARNRRIEIILSPNLNELFQIIEG